MLPSLTDKIAELAKLAKSKGLFPVLKREGKDVSKVWISPGNWKRMNPEKQAIVVALWHQYESYPENFPFKDLEAKKKSTKGLQTAIDGGIEGLRFEFYGKDVKKAGLVEALKEFKIPHTVELEKPYDYDGDTPKAVRSG